VSLSRRAKLAISEAKIFYGWVIVAVGFLAHIASAFSISSTLSVFLKPLSQDLGISRGVFSLIRSGEILVGAVAAPLVGSLLDRHGGRWLIAAGGLVSGAGFLLLGQARDFWQFAIVRWLLISPGDTLMGSMVVNVSISQWFLRMRGRALALAGMGHGLAKVCMPLLAAPLILYVGWRGAWVVFGALTLALVVGPSLLLMRRRPEDMGLLPDGRSTGESDSMPAQQSNKLKSRRSPAEEVTWSRAEALRTRAFWLIVTTFGVAHVGVTGLNLHVFSYVSDQGHPAMVAALVMSIIAVMQFSTPMVWGVLAERANVARLIMAKFLIQAFGILLALSDPGVVSLYAGFFLYGIGMGGTSILAEMIWANYFGRISLGRIRGMGSLITSAFSAGGPPFFGLLFDATQSYSLSFSIFIAMLFASAFLSLFLRAPAK
jgi:OFA family oxalate/formate antiporter-like MFS transporter